MTKAKARKRAKAKASQKVKKRETDLPGQKIRPGQFDPGARAMKSVSVNANIKNFAGAKRGAARSR